MVNTHTEIGEDYDWQMVNMIRGNQNKKIIDKITNKPRWMLRTAHEKEFFNTSLRGKI